MIQTGRRGWNETKSSMPSAMAGHFQANLVQGSRLEAFRSVLQGAIPAALMAIVPQGLFFVFDRFIIP
jgi:ABC-type proline/glycine betaine transport system permease subunit